MITRWASRALAGLALALAQAVAAQGQPVLNEPIRKAVDAGEYEGLHAVIVRLGGETLAEVYFSGKDEAWGRDLGVVRNGPDVLHDIRSVTKSVTGLVYGIALAEGKVPPPDAVLIDQFPEYADLADPDRRRITVGDALAMRMGTEWNEDVPYTSAANSEVAMEMSGDRYRFALDRPQVAPPDTAWTYNGGAVALVERLIAQGTGMPLDRYAAEKLFVPMDIAFEWTKGDDGAPSAASGLRLTARGLAKLGELVLANGAWNGEQLVPADWLAQSFTPRSDLDELRYGYLWWLAGAGSGETPAWVAGFGNGGQRLTIQPDIGLVYVVLAGNYNQPDAWRVPVGLLEGIVAPGIRAWLSR